MAQFAMGFRVQEPIFLISITKCSTVLGNLRLSVFQSETFAINMAVNFSLDMKWTNKTIYFCSDSQASLKALDKVVSNSKLVLECKMLLNVLGGHNKVNLIWVPGHCGVEGNEKADFLARKGSNLEMFGPEPAIGISKSSVMHKLILNISTSQWNRWILSSSCRQTKEFNLSLDKSRQKYLLSLNRPNIKIIMDLITGHCGLNYHIHKIGIANSSLCDACMEDVESATHFLCECPAFSGIRNRIFGTHLINPKNILSKDFPLIMKFVNQTKRFVSS